MSNFVSLDIDQASLNTEKMRSVLDGRECRDGARKGIVVRAAAGALDVVWAGGSREPLTPQLAAKIEIDVTAEDLAVPGKSEAKGPPTRDEVFLIAAKLPEALGDHFLKTMGYRTVAEVRQEKRVAELQRVGKVATGKVEAAQLPMAETPEQKRRIDQLAAVGKAVSR